MRTAFFALALTGCVGDLTDLQAAATTTDLKSAKVDAGSDGGTGFEPVFADLTRLGCATASCHGGTQSPILKSDAASRMATYQAFVAAASAGSDSTVLTKNLAGDNVAHVGGKPFASTSDPTYVRWLAWIAAGTPL